LLSAVIGFSTSFFEDNVALIRGNAGVECAAVVRAMGFVDRAGVLDSRLMYGKTTGAGI
jgi:hypothetical protein